MGDDVAFLADFSHLLVMVEKGGGKEPHAYIVIKLIVTSKLVIKETYGKEKT